MWKWIRIPKGIALLAFLLPWMTVSCSNQKLVEASGFGLAFGRVTAMGQASQASDGATLNYWLILALLAIAGGLVLLFIKGREAAKLVLGTSVAALVLIFVGTYRYSKDAITAEAAKNGSNGNMDQAALAMIQVNWEIGYWLALIALIAAAVMAWLVMSGKEAEAEAKMRSLGAGATDAARGVAAKASDAIDAAKDKKDDEPPKG
jgi:phosphoglycerol transferase MdoB-like AlkP superfamily enzyme